MDKETWKFVNNLIPHTYAKQASDAMSTVERNVRKLLQNKKLPEEGWSDLSIKFLMNQLAMMDSNNFQNNCGVGEREGRLYSDMVIKRNFHMGHGIGRSGMLGEPQPKAAGTSLMYILTNHLLQDIFSIMGITSNIECALMPLCTGMSLMMCLLALKKENPSAKYVIWSRIDQKACFKSITAAGLIPVIIDTQRSLTSEELVTDMMAIEAAITSYSHSDILCVMTTTSCFAPRVCDNIEDVAQLCKAKNIPHVINNAYGLQCKSTMQRIQSAFKAGRIDYVVQSCDKNLMVPVGGAIVACFKPECLKAVLDVYPGRASASSVIDVFITLLSMGRNGFKKIVEERKTNFALLKHELKEVLAEFGEEVLNTPTNTISIAFSLKSVKASEVTRMGSMLFIRMVTGAIAQSSHVVKVIDGHEFKGWGTHSAIEKVPYMTVSAAMGITRDEIKLFIMRLIKLFKTTATGDDSPEVL